MCHGDVTTNLAFFWDYKSLTPPGIIPSSCSMSIILLRTLTSLLTSLSCHGIYCWDKFLGGSPTMVNLLDVASVPGRCFISIHAWDCSPWPEAIKYPCWSCGWVVITAKSVINWLQYFCLHGGRNDWHARLLWNPILDSTRGRGGIWAANYV